MQATLCQGQCAFEVKNTFVHAEPIVQKGEFDLDVLPCFWRQESEPALCSRAFTRSATARKAFVAARLLSSDGHENTSAGHIGKKLVGQSPTAETMDECGAELTDSDGSESDQSSEAEWEPCAMLEQMEDLTDSVKTLDQVADPTDSVGLVEEPEDIREPLHLPEQPEDFSWVVQSEPVASGDLCRQTTEQCWPTYVDHALNPAAKVEPHCHGLGDIGHIVGNVQPFFAPAFPLMWPHEAMFTGSVVHMDVGAARQHASTNVTCKARRSKRKFNPMSLISLAEQAQQFQREEQQLKKQQEVARWKTLHAVQPQQKQEQHQRSPTGLDSSESTVPKFCPYCGNGILPHFKCCPFCGSALSLAIGQKSGSD